MSRIAVKDRREALAEAATRVLARDGVAGTTTRAIAAEAGMSLASVHYAYASREELLQTAVEQVVEREEIAIRKEIDATTRRTASAGERGGDALGSVLSAAFSAYVGSLCGTGSGLERGMLEITLASLRGRENPAIAPAQYRRYHALVAAILVDAADLTGMRWTTAPEGIARTLVAVLDGLTIAHALSPEATADTLTHLLPGILALAEPGDPTARSEGTAS